MTKVITIASGKGGVGKTTTTSNIAFFLSKKKKRVLVIDLDPQGGLSHSFSGKNLHSEKNIFDLIKNANRLKKIECEIQYNKYLSYLPSDRKLRELDKDFSVSLKKIVSLVNSKYDFILFDTPPGMSAGSKSPLLISDYFLMPVQAPGGLSVLGVDMQGELISEVLEINPNIKLLGILLSFVNRTKLCKDVILHLRKEYGSDVMENVVRENTHLAQASCVGLPVGEHSPRSNGSNDYKKVVNEILERVTR